MKKLIILLLLATFMANIAYASSKLPTVIVEKIDPQPVEPGSDLIVSIVMYNRLTTESGEFSVVVDAIPNQLVLKSSSEDLRNVNLCADCSKKNTFFLSVSPDAVSGTYTIYLRAYSNNVAERHRIDIRVRGKPSLVFSTASDLGSLTPNSRFSVMLDVKNIGSGYAKQIKIQPESDNFIVVGSPVQTIDSLGAGGTKQVNFTFVAAPSLEAGPYLIPFKLSYLDEQGGALNSSQNLGLNIINKGEISIQSIKTASSSGSSVITAGQPFTAVIRLENVGYGDANSVIANITCPFDGAKKSFLGQLRKEEDAPVVFDFVPQKPGNFICGLAVSYKDDTGSHEFTEKFDIIV
ncbi:MAG: CARDB domain-containing protein, partial [Candidatus Aenigmarchaeota archaeon]|nr:CARDB domain-containing protein [Candidatus Aenigmarchaeota archaeon]